MTTTQPPQGDAADSTPVTLDDANGIVLRLDGRGRVISLNPFGLAFFGFTCSEIVGRHVVGSIVPPADRTGEDLGSAATYGIVKRHNGCIEVYSEPDIGSQVNVLLPAAGGSRRAEVPIDRLTRKGTETILVVDDEPDVLDAAQHMLALPGYTVITAGGSDAAVDRFSARQGTIDLVIMDMIMPGPPVDQTIARLMRSDPCLRILLSSGYSPTDAAVDKLAATCQGFIQKPFRLVSLSHTIREIVEVPADAHS